MAANITGKLRNAFPQDLGEFWRLIGVVYGDDKGRFEDGTSIYTSRIVSLKDGVATTRNSIYEIESWASDDAKQEAEKLSSDGATA